MSLIAKVRSYLSKPARDAATIVIQGDATHQKYDPFNFVSDLILYEKHTLTNWSHREAVARHDPIARFICQTVPEVTFDDGFSFTDAKEQPIEALSPLLDVLDLLDYRRVFTQADKYARVHGWAAIYLSEKSVAAQDARGDEEKLEDLTQRPLPPGARIGRLLVYAGERDVQVKAIDTLGNPTAYEITQSLKQGHQHREVKFTIHPSRLLIITPRPIRYGQVQGITALDPVWDQLTLRRNIEYAMAFHAIKYGGGFVKAQKETGSWTDDEKAEAQRELHRASMKQALMMPGGATVEWIGPSNTVNYHDALDACLDAIAAGSQIPKDLLKGVSAGSITGSETNLQEYYSLISQNQELYEPYLRRLCIVIAPTQRTLILTAQFDWSFSFTMSEKEQADVDLVRAQEDQIKLNYMSVDEIRQEKGLAHVDGGETVQGIKQFESPMFGASIQGEQPPPQQEQRGAEPQPTAKERDALRYASQAYGRSFQSFRELDAYLSPQSLVTSFCRDADVGKGTYYDWRQKYA